MSAAESGDQLWGLVGTLGLIWKGKLDICIVRNDAVLTKRWKSLGEKKVDGDS